MGKLNRTVGIATIMLALTALLVTSCDEVGIKVTARNLAEASRYSIGDIGPSGVGIVFYVYDEGLHGLEAAPVDQGNSYWSFYTGTLIGTTGTGMGDGPANTNAIIIQNTSHYSAAHICRAYRTGVEGDWFLPSRDELSLMYTNLMTRGLGGFLTYSPYWSSSEVNADNVWCFNFEYGVQTSDGKGSIHPMRAIRAF